MPASGPGVLEQHPSTLTLLRDCFQRCAVGVTPTPGGLGLMLMRTHYPRDQPLLYRPAWPTWATFKDTLTGGRADLLTSVHRIPELYEADMSGAYVAAACSIPHGTPIAIAAGEDAPWMTRTYRYYEVQSAEVPLGPLHRRQRAHGRLDYPSRAGERWNVWLWDNEAGAAARVGWHLDPGEGFAFGRESDALAPWAHAWWDLREGADAAVAPLIKQAGVAALGRLAMDNRAYELIPLDPKLATWEGGNDARHFSMRQTLVESEGMLPHVYSAICATLRCLLYSHALAEATEANLLATNVDALYTARLPRVSPSAGLGGWRIKKLTDATIDRVRWLDSVEKVRHPGEARRKAS